MKNDRRKLYVTYNFPPINHWRQLFSEFLGEIMLSGLYERSEEVWIFTRSFGILNEIQENLRRLDKLRFFICDTDKFIAMEQLRRLSEHSKKILGPRAYLYSSARGISYSIEKDPKRFLAVKYWAKMLNYYSIFEYEHAIKKLGEFDAVGTNWVADGNIHKLPPHFQGMGWWATDEYLRSLPDVPTDSELIQSLSQNPLYAQRPGKNPGWGLWGEFWIGFGNPRVYEQFSAYPKHNPLNWHYHNLILESSYDKTFINA